MENRFGTFGDNDPAKGLIFNQRISEIGNELIDEHNETVGRLDKKEILNTTTLTAAGWSGTAPYTQTVAVAGITAGRLPDKIIPQYSATTATAILQKEAFSMISYYDTGAGTITFTCLEDKPTTAIPLQIVGV